MALILSVLEQGLIYAILALGVYITYKILDFPDMSVDSSFPLGAPCQGRIVQKMRKNLCEAQGNGWRGAKTRKLGGVSRLKRGVCCAIMKRVSSCGAHAADA